MVSVLHPENKKSDTVPSVNKVILKTKTNVSGNDEAFVFHHDVVKLIYFNVITPV